MGNCRIGMGRVRLTPDEAGAVTGWGPPGPKQVRGPDSPDQELFATALALDDGVGNRAVFVNADLHCGGRHLWRAAVEASGLDGARVVVCGTHTHAGPGQRYSALYTLFASARPTTMASSGRRLGVLIRDAVTQAIGSLAPGGVDVVRGPALGTASNRAVPAWSHYEDEVRSEFATAGPGADLAGERHEADRLRDPRVTALVAASDDGSQRCVLAWHAVHGTSLGPTWPTFGADLFGVAREHVQRAVEGTVVGFGGGASGDISPLPLDERGRVREDDQRPTAQGRELAETVGTRLGEALVSILPSARPAPFSLAVAHEIWEPTRTGLPSPLFGMATAGGGVDGPSDRWEELSAGVGSPPYRAKRSKRRPIGHGQGPKISIAHAITWVPLPVTLLMKLIAPRRLPIHVVRVGDHAFATVPGEPTTITGWRIEEAVRRSAETASASVIGFAGDYAGYWVSPEEYLEQRYEGSSTIYGRESATALEQRLAALAAEVRSPRSDDSS